MESYLPTVRRLGRIVAPVGFGCARQLSTTLSAWAIVPISMGVTSCSTFTRRSPRSGQGPKGHSSVNTTHAGRFDALPFVRLGRLGTGTALCTPVMEISGGV